MQQYMKMQKKKIELDKWFEGCRTNNDPGQKFILEWVRKNGSWFRNAWGSSLCKNCRFCDECGHELKDSCEEFIKRHDN